MSIPAQGYDHELNATKGWFSPYALDKVVTVASDSAVILPGSVCSLTAAGKLQLGLAHNAIPLFARNGSESMDAIGDPGNVVGSFQNRFYGVQALSTEQAARVHVLVAMGAYELETTEFVSGSYSPNDALTSAQPGEATAGKLAVGEYYTDTVCGAVSDGTAVNNYGKSVLRFWPLFVPASAGSN